MSPPEWIHTLRWRLIWPSIVVNLIAVALTAWTANFILSGSLQQQAKARAEIVSHAVNYVAESVVRTTTLQRFINSIGAERDISLIIVAGNHSPHVVACTRREYNGASLESLPWPEVIAALKEALYSGRTLVQEIADGGEFQMVTPLIQSDVQRPDLVPRPGAVLVRFNEVPGRAEITRLVWLGASFFILLLLGTNVLLLLLIKRRVVYPLELIHETLRKRSQGDTSARAPVITRDAIGVVANAMNAVFDRREELETEASLRAAELTAANSMLKESEERFRIAAESATDLIYDWDLSTGHIIWHRDIGTALGYAPGEFSPTQEAWFKAISLEERESVLADITRHVQTGEPFDREYRMVAKDGGYRYWRDRGRGIYNADGKPQRVIGVMTNVTAERLASQQLHAAKEAAESASRAKDDFLAALSHELRTPLNPVLMLAGEMERSPDVPPDIREGFALIRHNVELEARLIDDLLDLTRITRGKFHLDRIPLDINASIEKAVETVRSMIEARGLTLQLELTTDNHYVSGDPVRLQQVFWNVLKNAAKFTSSGGRIVIRSSTLGNDALRISITDTGLGIEPEHLERIFQPFEQVHHPATHRFGGLGLGLAISRKLVEAHGGEVWAESAGAGQGTTFHIVLPLLAGTPSVTSAEAAPPAVVPAPQTAALYILLVEDHEQTRVILTRLLQRRGHHVSTAADVSTARTLAKEHEFDLVISDIGLPDGSGYDLMAELRRDHPNLLGIALSGFGMEHDIRHSREVGFFAHLTKPVDMQALDRTIADAQHHESFSAAHTSTASPESPPTQ